MSADEMREFCERVSPYRLRVQVRLKNDDQIFVGRIVNVEHEGFQLSTEGDGGIQTLRYSWVARIKNA